MKKNRINPAFLPKINSIAWQIAGRCYKQNISYNDMMAQARSTPDDTGNLPNLVESYRRDFGYNQHSRLDKLKRRIAERLPQRNLTKEVPFYLRKNYILTYVDYLGSRYMPDLNYTDLAKPFVKYVPIDSMKIKLHNQRYDWLRRYSDGLIRWPDTISSGKCEFVVTKNFNTFYFKIDAATPGNKLPVVKTYNSLSVTIHAPREFFEQHFWGLGEHLIVRVLDRYELEDGTKVLKTQSCDRENLYALTDPNILKDRFYVEKDTMKGTGLTEQAAVKSMQYYMGKEISFALGT